MQQNTSNHEKIVIYPYSSEIDPILIYNNLLLPKYKVCNIISPKGWGYTNDRFIMNNGDVVKVEWSFDSIDKEANLLLVPDFTATESFEKKVIENIINNFSNINKIICDKKFSKDNTVLLKNFCKNNNIYIKYRNDYLYKNSVEDVYNEITDYNNYKNSKKLNKIDTPIIAIAGLYENTDKFNTSLVVINELKNNGYKVALIGSREYCELIGCHEFPYFMYDPKINEIKKIYLLNNFIKNISINDNPDVIVITIPGAIHSISDDFPGNFGILQYITFKSILLDYLIMCTFFDYDSKNFLKMISDSCFYKYGSYVDCFHMSDCYINHGDIKEKNKIKINNVGKDTVTKYLKQNYQDTQTPILNLYQDSDKSKIYELIINKLS